MEFIVLNPTDSHPLETNSMKNGIDTKAKERSQTIAQLIPANIASKELDLEPISSNQCTIT